MNQTALLYDPIVETREVLESYRVDGVLVDGWRARLEEASEQLIGLGTTGSDQELVELGQGIRALATLGVPDQTDRADALATEVARRLDQLNSTEMSESYEDWAF